MCLHFLHLYKLKTDFPNISPLEGVFQKGQFSVIKKCGPKPVWLSEVQNLHLLVSCARRTFSDEKVSSRSNRSSMGGGKSLKAGGKT